MSELQPTISPDDQRLHSLRFNIVRNALYQIARRLFLERMGRLLNFVVILAGAAALTDIFPDAYLHIIKSGGALAALLAGTLQLVFDFGGQARTHEFLQRRFYLLLADIDSRIRITDADLARWTGELTEMYADEPPILRALDAVAYNEASDALGFDKRLVVTRWQESTRQFFSWGQASFDEIEVKPRPSPTH